MRINAPTTPTEISAWSTSTAFACVIPDGRMPDALNGVPFDAWRPDGPNAWPTVILDEPVLQCPRGLRPAAGAVVLEVDGRCWLAMPTNAFGGLPYVFPKGRVDPRASLTATAMREVWEELGLRVRLTGHLIDVRRSTTYTRLYLAERIGGHPAGMGWESQAAVLCPLERLPELLPSSYDAPIVEALRKVVNELRTAEAVPAHTALPPLDAPWREIDAWCATLAGPAGDPRPIDELAALARQVEADMAAAGVDDLLSSAYFFWRSARWNGDDQQARRAIGAVIEELRRRGDVLRP